tara:strand:+ start:6218 stop:7018 length:801 start_codon:yes stop_codon:yes gene_type:complete
MKKILLVSGCSFTDRDFHSDIHPDMICDWPRWPELVAEALDMECVNLSISGSGNERIYSTLSDYLTTPKDKQPTFVSKRHLMDKQYEFAKGPIGLVVAAWSHGHRRDWSTRSNVKREDKRDLWTNLYFDEKGDIHYHILKSIRLQYAFQNLCKQLELPYCQFQMLSLWKAYIHEKKAGNTGEWEREFFNLIKSTGYNSLINKNFLGWPGDVVNDKYYGEKSWTLSDCLSPELRISEKDAHPNEMGQHKLAEEFLKRLHENKILQKD